MIIKWIQPNVEEHPCDARVFSLDTASILCATVSRFFIFRCLYFYTPPAMCLCGDEKPHVLLKSSLTLSSSRPPKKKIEFFGGILRFSTAIVEQEEKNPVSTRSALCILRNACSILSPLSREAAGRDSFTVFSKCLLLSGLI